MIFDYQSTSSLDLAFDDATCQLIVGEGIVVKENLVRKLKEMKDLFKEASNYNDDLSLYYMYNQIYRKEHYDLFESSGIKYEYTLLLPVVINGECVKAHGHIHGVSPITKTNYLEIYEVLGGTGYFELFKIEENKCEIILIAVKEGDFVVIPPEYYHLSINSGEIPFNFGDLIVNDPASDYALLKEYQGAPLFCMKDTSGNISFELNKNYQNMQLSFRLLDADKLPWDYPVAKIPLYAHFVANPHYFDFLK
jgi:oxalate decarboxylase/phosphoglucose isomerase-like protein (cupin superfamily)